jgi:copper chaperone CopZ
VEAHFAAPDSRFLTPSPCYPELVTKVEIHYDLVRPLTDADAGAIADVHSWYGMTRVRVTPDMKAIDVEYDASRLSEKDVEAVLVRFGIPIQRKWSL